MGQLDSIVSVQITRETTVPTAAGFGTLLLLGQSSVLAPNTVASYNSFAEVADVFSSSDAEYNFAQAFFGQSKKAPVMKIARAVPNGGSFILKQGAATNLTITLNGQVVTGAALANLATNLAALDDVASATVADTDYILVVMNAGYAAVIADVDADTGTLVAYQGNISSWNFGTAFDTLVEVEVDGTADTSAVSYQDLVDEIVANVALDVVDGFALGNAIYLVSDLATPNVLTNGEVNSVAAGSVGVETTKTMSDILGELADVDSDFYALASISTSEVNVLSIAGYAESNEKLFFTRSADAAFLTVPDVTSIGYQLKQLGLDRTVVCYHGSAATQYLDAAIAGRQLPENPGSVDWDLIRLALVTPDALTSGQIVAIESTNSNYFRTIAGANYFRQGKVASGEWIDIIRGTDWLKARMQERVFTTLANAPKVPYTNRGIGLIEADVRAQLDDGITQGLLANEPAYTVTVPDALTVSAADKANRVLRNVSFTATYAGAINKVEIQGTISL